MYNQESFLKFHNNESEISHLCVIKKYNSFLGIFTVYEVSSTDEKQL